MNFSFQNELTFAPKLNSLSLKLAGVNRTSILERSTKKKNTTLDSSFTFQPVVSDNSAKIVAKLKTGFLERQKLHTKRQKEKIDQGPSTIHPNLKPSKEAINEKDGRVSKQLLNSLSDQTCQHSPDAKKLNPYSISVDAIAIREKRKQVQHNIEKVNQVKIKHNSYMSSVDMVKTTETKIHKSPNPQRQIENSDEILSAKSLSSVSKEDTIGCDDSSSTNELQTAREDVQTRKKTFSKSTSKLHESSQHAITQQQAGKNLKENHHTRSFTYPSMTLKARTNKMDLEHQNLIKVKKVVSQAMKSKKVFMCNGPYCALRQALRRRGWVEKYYKGEPFSCVIGKDEKKDKNHVKTNQQEVENNGSGFNSDESTKKTTSETRASNSEELCTEVFASDSQYNIMSRIVRNAIPTLIWTLKRDDIDFRLLQKDQIVNHYASASFTTKTGLSTHLRNIVAFDAKNWLDFFPRCYRLCCDDERQEFIDDYRLTTIQCIMKLVILKHQEWRDVETKQNALSEELQKNCYEDCGDLTTCPPTNLTTISSKHRRSGMTDFYIED